MILLFWFYCVLRSFTSIDPLLSLESSLFYGRFVLFALCVSLNLKQYPKIYTYVGWSLWSTLVIVAFDAFLQFITGFNLLGWPQTQFDRLSGLFGTEHVVGSFLSRLLPLGFFFLAIQFF